MFLNRTSSVLLLTLAVAAALTGCAPSSSSSEDVISNGPTPHGVFVESNNVNLYNAKIETQTVGCAEPGSSDVNGKPHPGLSIGDESVSSSVWLNQTGSWQVRARSVVSSIKDDAIATKITILTAAGIDLRAGATFDQVCTLEKKAQGYFVSCKIQPDLPKPKMKMESYCYVNPNAGQGETVNSSVGQYIINGKSIKAYRTERTMVGEIRCKRNDGQAELSLGQGKTERVEITSNDVVSSDFRYCGGTWVFSYERITDLNGSVVSLHRFELEKPIIKNAKETMDTSSAP